MMRKLFVTSIVLLVLGTVARVYASNYTYIDANNVLRDTAWLPIGSFMMLGGMLLLAVAGIVLVLDRIQLR